MRNQVFFWPLKPVKDISFRRFYILTKQMLKKLRLARFAAKKYIYGNRLS